MAPPTTGFGDPLFVRRRSPPEMTVVVCDWTLLPRLVSASAVSVAIAVIALGPGPSARNTTSSWRLSLPLPPTVPSGQVTVPAARAHGAVADTKVAPLGTGTDSTTLVAASGELLSMARGVGDEAAGRHRVRVVGPLRDLRVGRVGRGAGQRGDHEHDLAGDGPTDASAGPVRTRANAPDERPPACDRHRRFPLVWKPRPRPGLHGESGTGSPRGRRLCSITSAATVCGLRLQRSITAEAARLGQRPRRIWRDARPMCRNCPTWMGRPR